jgi:hypothetical protein
MTRLRSPCWLTVGPAQTVRLNQHRHGAVLLPGNAHGPTWYPPSFSPSGTMVAKNSAFGRATGNTPMAQPNLVPDLKTEAEGFGIGRAFDAKTAANELFVCALRQ